MQKVLLIVDTGHYSGTPGKRTPAFADGTIIHEYQFNRPTALKLMELGLEEGFEIVDTLPKNVETLLETRVKTAKDAAEKFRKLNPTGAILFVSIHYNAIMNTWNGSTVAGSETFHNPGSIEGLRLATFVQNEIVKGTSQKSRGVKASAFYVLKYTTMPAILCEFGFMDDPREAALMLVDEFQQECANEVMAGIKKYLGIKDEVKTTEEIKTFLLRAPSATVEQAQAWAETQKAPQEFIDLAPLYWEIWTKIGLDPAIGYVQFAHETGFLYRDGKSMAGIDASYHNPCGLKTTSGGPDTQSIAHTKFPDWQTGIIAHADHAALYAGAQGYPKSITPDPRHFVWIKGVAKTLESLGARWAPNPQYGIGIRNNLLVPLQNTIVIKPYPPTPPIPPVVNWKEEIVKEAFELGLISDLNKWLDDPDQTMPAWAVLGVILTSFKKGKEK